MFKSVISLWRRAWNGLTLREMVKQLGAAIRRDGPFDLAAQLAYWSLLALFPFAILVLTLTAYLPLHGLDTKLMEIVRQLMPGDAASLFEGTLHDVIGKQRGWLLAVALGGALWSAAGGVSATMTALNKAWEVEESRSFLKTKLIALGVTVAATVLLIIVLGALIVGPGIGHRIFTELHLGSAFDLAWRLLRWPIVCLTMMVGLALVYWRLPDVKRRFRFISPGALVATVLWIGASLGFGEYATHLGGYSAVYGTLGTAIVLMTWLYLSGLVVILGGVVNAILDRAALKGDRSSASHSNTGGSAMQSPSTEVTSQPVASEVQASPIVATPHAMSTMDLVRESVSNATELAKSQIELFRLEAMQEMRSELAMIVKVAIAGAVGLLAIAMLLFAGVSAIAQGSGLPVWAVALMTAGGLLVMVGVLAALGWSGRVRRWLPFSRMEIAEELSWAKHQKI